jgi:hypothetical protein
MASLMTLGAPPQWAEPESNSVNVVDFTPGPQGEFHVGSDFSVFTQFPINTNDARIQVGSVTSGPVFATFHDLGDVATTPDTGTTASMFALSLTGLAFLRRKFC